MIGSSYLVDPAGFPTRREGEPWGTESLCLRLAGHPFRIEGLARSQGETLGALWGESGSDPICAETLVTPVSVFRVEESTFRRIDFRGWSYAFEFEYGPAQTRMVGVDLMGCIDWSTGLRGALWITTDRPGPFHGAMENFLRVLLAHAILFDGGVLFHSAAIISGSRGCLFAGHSGAGKSTVAGLAMQSGRTVVSDDLNVVLPSYGGGEEGYDIVSSRFFGDMGSRGDARYPLTSIYRLDKGPRDDVIPMGPAEAAASLVACAPYVNRSRHLEDALWSNVTTLLHSVPASILKFRREGTFWHMLAP